MSTIVSYTSYDLITRSLSRSLPLLIQRGILCLYMYGSMANLLKSALRGKNPVLACPQAFNARLRTMGPLNLS